MNIQKVSNEMNQSIAVTFQFKISSQKMTNIYIYIYQRNRMFSMYNTMFNIIHELHQIENEIIQTPFSERVLKHILMMNIRNMIAATKIFTKCNTDVTFRVFAYHIQTN